MPNLEIKGSRATQAALEQFPQKLTNKAVRQVLRDAMKRIVLATYKRTAPRGAMGKLAKAAKVRVAKSRRNTRFPRGTIGIAVRVFGVRYASFRLLGTKWMKGSRTLTRALLDKKHQFRVYFDSRMRRKIPEIAAEVRRSTKRLG